MLLLFASKPKEVHKLMALVSLAKVCPSRPGIRASAAISYRIWEVWEVCAQKIKSTVFLEGKTGQLKEKLSGYTEMASESWQLLKSS